MCNYIFYFIHLLFKFRLLISVEFTFTADSPWMKAILRPATKFYRWIKRWMQQQWAHSELWTSTGCRLMRWRTDWKADVVVIKRGSIGAMTIGVVMRGVPYRTVEHGLRKSVEYEWYDRWDECISIPHSAGDLCSTQCFTLETKTLNNIGQWYRVRGKH